MHRTRHLQFKLLSPEAQRAALWRLAWAGLTPGQIAQHTGLTAAEVSQAMHEELEPSLPTRSPRPEGIAANA